MKKVVKFVKLNENAILPTYAHAGDAGMDLFSTADITIQPMEHCLVPTGLAMELPAGTEAQVRSKSGIALKNGVFVLNSPGTIDENYRGEVGVILFNLGKQPHIIKKGQKIAQMVICNVEYVSVQEQSKLSSTTRGAGGFGSTGI